MEEADREKILETEIDPWLQRCASTTNSTWPKPNAAEVTELTLISQKHNMGKAQTKPPIATVDASFEENSPWELFVQRHQGGELSPTGDSSYTRNR